MAGRFHKFITNVLLQLGEELAKSKTRLVESYDGNKTPIKIINPIGRMVMGWNYYPDVYYATKFEKKYIFEIVDRENSNEIIADFMQAVLSQAKAIIFITNPERKSEIENICYTLRNILTEVLKVRKKPLWWDCLSFDLRTKEIRVIKREIKQYVGKYIL